MQIIKMRTDEYLYTERVVLLKYLKI